MDRNEFIVDFVKIDCVRLDRIGRRVDRKCVNRDLIRLQLRGMGPFIIRTSDGKEYIAPHSEFVMVGRYNVVIEDQKGLLDIIDPLRVVSIRPGGRRKRQTAGD